MGETSSLRFTALSWSGGQGPPDRVCPEADAPPPGYSLRAAGHLTPCPPSGSFSLLPTSWAPCPHASSRKRGEDRAVRHLEREMERPHSHNFTYSIWLRWFYFVISYYRSSLSVPNL